MPDNNSQLNQEIDAGRFFLTIFYIAFIIGLIWFTIWFYTNVYKPEEQAYINGSKYAYNLIHKEMIDFYEKNGKVFSEKNKNDDNFCYTLVSKYAENGQGNCSNINPISATQNFVFKKKKITISGLEKPPIFVDGACAKDIIIDVNGENEGENQVGVDRTILRIYSHGRIGGIITPVNCSREDEENYGFKKSFYCIGSPELDYLTTNKPLGFDIEQIGGDNGKTRKVSNNIPFVRADCSAFNGDILASDDYCDEKQLYGLRACDDEYTCNIVLSKQ